MGVSRPKLPRLVRRGNRYFLRSLLLEGGTVAAGRYMTVAIDFFVDAVNHDMDATDIAPFHGFSHVNLG